MGYEGERARVERELQARARERALAYRLERLERRVARLSAAIDGASVTLVPVAERWRPPSAPDPAAQLQRIAGSRVHGTADDDR